METDNPTILVVRHNKSLFLAHDTGRSALLHLVAK